MSVTAGLWIVPAEEFDKTDDSRVTPDLPRGGTWFSLDKAWDEFDELFQSMPPPLDRVIRGDVWPEGRLDEERDPEDATWLGFVSPGTVAALGDALALLEPAEIVQQLMEKRRLVEKWSTKEDEEFDRQYFTEYFEQLRRAYRTAADARAGLGVLLC